MLTFNHFGEQEKINIEITLDKNGQGIETIKCNNIDIKNLDLIELSRLATLFAIMGWDLAKTRKDNNS